MEAAREVESLLTSLGGSLESFIFISFVYIRAVSVERSGITMSMHISVLHAQTE
jgi:hypothetical protein